MGMIQRTMEFIEKVSEKVGRLCCYVVLLMMIVTTTEAVARYVFNNPLPWTWILNRQLFGIFILFAGVYTMQRRDHIRIEIVYDYLPPKIKAIARGIALVSACSFLGVLVWQSSWMGLNSFNMRELWQGAFRFPLYPLKMLIPVVSFWFLLQAIVSLLRDDP